MVLAEKKQRLNVQHSPILPESDPRPVARAGTAARKRTLLALMILAGFAICMLYTYQVSRFFALGLQAENVQGKIADLQTENKRMELEMAELQAPERVEQVAINKLGMTEPADFLVAASTSEQPPQEAPLLPGAHPAGYTSPGSTWSSRLLALLPRFTGQAEASTR